LGTEDELVATAEQIKRLPYLDACINEALRIQSVSGIGLPRVAPEGGLNVLGHYFPEGTVLSVPSYSVHRDVKAWGEDAESFRPERWFERDQTELHKAFNPYSVGPRYVFELFLRWIDVIQTCFSMISSCVGRNLAAMELSIILASVMRRYEMALNEEKPVSVNECGKNIDQINLVPMQDMVISEGFLRKPLSVNLSIKRRDI
jgi:benzoate 4-monooxygenase